MALNTTPASPTADSYAAISDFKAYSEALGRDITEYTDESIEAFLRAATAYIDGLYSSRFIGKAATTDQALEWPRKKAKFRGEYLPTDVIPAKVIRATCEAAYQVALDADALSSSFSAASQVTREKVGELEVQYADTSSLDVADTIPRYSVIDGLLFGLIDQVTRGAPSFATAVRV